MVMSIGNPVALEELRLDALARKGCYVSGKGEEVCQLS